MLQKSVQDLETEASRRHLERIEAERAARQKQWGGLMQRPVTYVTVRPGIDPETKQRFRRVLDGSGGFLEGDLTFIVPRNEWISRRIADGSLEELTDEEAAKVVNDDIEAKAKAAEEAEQRAKDAEQAMIDADMANRSQGSEQPPPPAPEPQQPAE